MTTFESGCFDRKNRKYIITNMTPTRPLVNYIWSEEFMMSLDHFGCGSSFGKVAYSTRRPLIGGVWLYGSPDGTQEDPAVSEPPVPQWQHHPYV